MSNTSKGWKRIRSEYGPDLKLFRARFDFMQNPRNDKTERMIVLESSDSVNVLARTPDEQLLFVRQYRFGIEEYTLEVPGGIVDPGESPATAAIRELREETGHTGEDPIPLGKIGSNPVFQDSWIYHYLIRNAHPTHALQLDDGEEVEVISLPLSDVQRMLHNGDFLHPHTVSALLRFFAHQEEKKNS